MKDKILNALPSIALAILILTAMVGFWLWGNALKKSDKLEAENIKLEIESTGYIKTAAKLAIAEITRAEIIEKKIKEIKDLTGNIATLKLRILRFPKIPHKAPESLFAAMAIIKSLMEENSLYFALVETQAAKIAALESNFQELQINYDSCSLSRELLGKVIGNKDQVIGNQKKIMKSKYRKGFLRGAIIVGLGIWLIGALGGK